LIVDELLIKYQSEQIFTALSRIKQIKRIVVEVPLSNFQFRKTGKSIFYVNL